LVGRSMMEQLSTSLPIAACRTIYAATIVIRRFSTATNNERAETQCLVPRGCFSLWRLVREEMTRRSLSDSVREKAWQKLGQPYEGTGDFSVRHRQVPGPIVIHIQVNMYRYRHNPVSTTSTHPSQLLLLPNARSCPPSSLGVSLPQ
jgi:hypothetical protein